MLADSPRRGLNSNSPAQPCLLYSSISTFRRHDLAAGTIFREIMNAIAQNLRSLQQAIGRHDHRSEAWFSAYACALVSRCAGVQATKQYL
jgi:hypothetical protein